MDFFYSIASIAWFELSKSIFIQKWLYPSPITEITSPLASPIRVQPIWPTNYIKFWTSTKITRWCIMIIVSQMRRTWRRAIDWSNSFPSSWYPFSIILHIYRLRSNYPFNTLNKKFQLNPAWAPKSTLHNNRKHTTYCLLLSNSMKTNTSDECNLSNDKSESYLALYKQI